MADIIKTSSDVLFDVLYADGTKYHADEGVLFEAKGQEMVIHLGTSRPEVLFAVPKALTNVIVGMGLGEAFKRYLERLMEGKQDVRPD